METELTNQKLEFTEQTISYLSETRKWTMFLSILGFIFIGLIVLGIPLIIGLQDYNKGPWFATFIPLILLVAIYFFPIYYLYMFSSLSKKAIRESDNTSMELAFKNLKSHYKFMGILVIILLCFYFIAGLVAGITFLVK